MLSKKRGNRLKDKLGRKFTVWYEGQKLLDEDFMELVRFIKDSLIIFNCDG
jgi:hypothetical protein